jgi:hypothetical protein
LIIFSSPLSRPHIKRRARFCAPRFRKGEAAISRVLLGFPSDSFFTEFFLRRNIPQNLRGSGWEGKNSALIEAGWDYAVIGQKQEERRDARWIERCQWRFY